MNYAGRHMRKDSNPNLPKEIVGASCPLDHASVLVEGIEPSLSRVTVERLSHSRHTRCLRVHVGAGGDGRIRTYSLHG